MTFAREIIMAFVDGELDPVTARRIENAMADDAELAEKVRSQRALRERLAARFDPILDEPVPGSLTQTLGAIDTSLVTRRRVREALFAGPAQWGALAASLAIGLFAGQMLWSSPGSLIAERGGTLVAGGQLDRALDTQLASSQASGSPTRVGLTFRNAAGAVCRTFEGRELSGVACRGDGQWQVRHAIAPGGGTAGEYRQASSGEIAGIAAAMMGPDGAFDAAQERRAMAAGWR